MGYVFKRQKSIASNFNRILSEQVKAAIDSLENPGELTGETIHSVRKRVKKIRALFRLVRSELKQKDFKRANSHYRMIGHMLSPLRDATVMIKTVEKLRQTYPDTFSPNLLATLRKALDHKQDQVAQEFFKDGNKIQQVADAFRHAQRTGPTLSKHHTSFAVFKPNMKAIYRQGRKALQVATQEPSSHHFHELRKEVKTIGYHTRLLLPVWPGLFTAYSQELERLGELLGDDHDYGVLAEEIESERLLLRTKQAKNTVLQLLHLQRTTLQQQIHPLAKRLFAEKANEFVGRYRLYWKLWQTEGKPEPSSD